MRTAVYFIVTRETTRAAGGDRGLNGGPMVTREMAPDLWWYVPSKPSISPPLTP